MEIHIHTEKGEQIWINNTPIEEEEVEEEPLTKRIMDAIDKYEWVDIDKETAENCFHVSWNEFIIAIAEILTLNTTNSATLAIKRRKSK